MLTPQIRGWAYYHRGVCARKAYEKVDHEIFKILWKWAKRRHLNKGLRWIKEKYFKAREGRAWCFGVTKKKGDNTERKELFLASSITVRRHRKIRRKANPFDKEWYNYFMERKSNNFSIKKDVI